MAGEGGNDTYIVDNALDTVTESSGEGTADLVESSISFSVFGQDIETLPSQGDYINATGNGLANILTGNNGINLMSGGDGVDNLNGRAGGDILIGGQAADIIDTGSPNDNLVDIVRFSATTEFGDTVFNFDTNGPSGNDRVEFERDPQHQP